MNRDKDSKHWKLGLFYYNPDNSSYVVDKRKGIGVTINFASKHGRHIILCILMPAIIVLILCVSTLLFT